MRAALSVLRALKVKSLHVMSVVDTGQVKEPVLMLRADVLTLIMPSTLPGHQHIIFAADPECPGNSFLKDGRSTHCRRGVFSSCHLCSNCDTDRKRCVAAMKREM